MPRLTIGQFVLALALVADGAGGALGASRNLSLVSWRDATFAAVVAARVAICAVNVMSGWLILRRRSTGLAFAPAALVLSAALTTIEVGWHVIPSNVYSAHRWRFVGVAWIYALVLTAFARTLRRQYTERHLS